MRCCNCNHVFQDITCDERSIKEMYETYGDERGSVYFQGIDSETLDNIDIYLKFCQGYCFTNTPTQRLLDIGCGTGALLGRAKKLGFAIEGIEVCKSLAKSTAKQMECTVHNNTLANLTFKGDNFDVITMYDLIEHLQDPGSDMQIVYNLLKTGGILFILCPNDHALVRKLSKLAYFLSYHHFDKAMRSLYYQDHLSYFVRESLLALLKRFDFEIVFLGTINQELGRLQLSLASRLGVRIIFHISQYFANLGGKLIVYARKI